MTEADVARWRQVPRDGIAAPRAAAATRRATQQVTYSKPGLRGLTAVALGAVGLVAGGRLGAAIEGDSCRCDDPGVKGFVIGAPIGAAIGAIIGLALVD